jgi:hypothetical protein
MYLLKHVPLRAVNKWTRNTLPLVFLERTQARPPRKSYGVGIPTV